MDIWDNVFRGEQLTEANTRHCVNCFRLDLSQKAISCHQFLQTVGTQIQLEVLLDPKLVTSGNSETGVLQTSALPFSPIPGKTDSIRRFNVYSPWAYGTTHWLEIGPPCASVVCWVRIIFNFGRATHHLVVTANLFADSRPSSDGLTCAWIDWSLDIVKLERASPGSTVQPSASPVRYLASDECTVGQTGFATAGTTTYWADNELSHSDSGLL